MGFFGDDQKIPRTVSLGEAELRCTICGRNEFWQRSAVMPAKAILSWQPAWWRSQSATCFVCSTCGYVHWFLAKA